MWIQFNIFHFFETHRHIKHIGFDLFGSLKIFVDVGEYVRETLKVSLTFSAFSNTPLKLSKNHLFLFKTMRSIYRLCVSKKISYLLNRFC